MSDDVNEATWHEQAHVRGIALEYALSMFRSDKLTKAEYLSEAGRYWHFLKDGTILETSMEVPNDLSDWIPNPDLPPGDQLPFLDYVPAVIGDTGMDLSEDEVPLPPESESS
jgi:hypothetical protein